MFRNRLPGLFAPTRSSRSFGEAVAVGGGSVAGPKTPWSAFLSEATLTFGPDGDFVVSDERTGFLPVIDPADVTYDQQHLAFASLKAEIP